MFLYDLTDLRLVRTAINSDRFLHNKFMNREAVISQSTVKIKNLGEKLITEYNENNCVNTAAQRDRERY